MISEGLSDAEDWNNGWWKYSSVITIIYHILKYIQIKKSVKKIIYIYIYLYKHFKILLFLLYFL